MTRKNKKRFIEITEIDGGVLAIIYQGNLKPKGEAAYFIDGEEFKDAAARALRGLMDNYLYQEDDEIILHGEDCSVERDGLFIAHKITVGYDEQTNKYYDKDRNQYDEPIYYVVDDDGFNGREIKQSDILARVNDEQFWDEENEADLQYGFEDISSTAFGNPKIEYEDNEELMKEIEAILKVFADAIFKATENRRERSAMIDELVDAMIEAVDEYDVETSPDGFYDTVFYEVLGNLCFADLLNVRP